MKRALKQGLKPKDHVHCELHATTIKKNEHMKTSNIIIISTFIVFILGFAINAAGIKKMYDHTNWNDPYRNYTKHNLNKTIDRVYVIAPDSTDTWPWESVFSIVQSKSNMLMLQNEAYASWQVTDSGLVVRLKHNAKGVLAVPNIKQVVIDKLWCKLTNFGLDSLQVNISQKDSKLIVLNSRINYLNASVSNQGQLCIEKENRVNKLNLALQGGVFSSGVSIRDVSQTITPDSRIELWSSALQDIAQKK